MREILFRGQRIDNGEWVYGYYVCDETGQISEEPIAFIYHLNNHPCGWDLIPFEVIPETVGQFTGLLDKNGTKIFEGDICRNAKTGEIVSVAWHGTMAGFVWNKRKEKSHLFEFGELFRAYDKYEVIGTIHDNPELMESEVTI